MAAWLFANSHAPQWLDVVVAFLFAFVLSTLLVYLATRICRRRHWTAKPRIDRWHRSQPGLFGGVPIWLAFAIGCAAFLPLHPSRLWTVILLATAMSIVGLMDDVFVLSPASKLFLQIAAATLLVSYGVVYPLRPEPFLNVVVSILWIVGVTNAFNLLDNMDGLSGGIAVIAALYLAFFYFRAGLASHVLLLVTLAGALAGFLLFNFKPARIFMGDTGSLFIGFLLGATSLLDVTHLSGVSAFVFVPVVVLSIPLFDTFFVSVSRRLRGSRISQGGTDHSSHRLVNLGVEERSAVLILYFLSAASGAVALVLRALDFQDAVGLLGFWFLFLLIFGVHLFHASHDAGSGPHPRLPLVERIFSRDLLAVVLDPLVLSFAYYVSYLLRFRSRTSAELSVFLASWPLVLSVKFVVLWICGIYRRSWWRGSRADLYRLVQAIAIGEVTTVLLLTGARRFAGYSRVVFIVDAVVSSLLLFLTRYSFLPFRDLLNLLRTAPPSRRVFVIGTSELTEITLRFLSQGHVRCVGLIDNNGGGDLGRRVWGKMVMGTIVDIGALAAKHGVSEIILPENETIPISENELAALCRQAKLRLTKLGLYEPTASAASASSDESSSARFSGAA